MQSDNRHLTGFLDKLAGLWTSEDSKARLWVTSEVADALPELHNLVLIDSCLGLVPSLASLSETLLNAQQDSQKCLNIVFPPFWGASSAPPDWVKEHGRSEFWQILSEQVLCNSSEKRQLAFILPAASLCGMRLASWRQEFFRHRSFVVLEGIQNILPAGFPRLSLSLMAIGEEGDSRIFIDVSKCLQDPDPVSRFGQDFSRLLKAKPGIKASSGFRSAVSLDDENRLSMALFSGDLQERISRIEAVGKAIDLSNVATISLGVHASTVPSAIPVGENIPLLSARDLLELQGVEFKESDVLGADKSISISSESSSAAWLLLNNDLCVSAIGKSGSRLKIFTYKGAPGRVAVNQTILVIRLSENLTPMQKHLVKEYLGSSFVADLIDGYYAGSMLDARRVSPRDLGVLKVPIADTDLQNAIEDLAQAKDAFTAWTKEVDGAIENIFAFSDAIKEARLLVMSSGKIARQRFQAATYVSDLSYRISNLYPFPVSYLWRYCQVSANSNYEQLRAVLRAAEGLTCFLATICLVMSRHTEIPIAHVNEISKRLADKRRGTTFGDWFHIVETVLTAKSFKRFDGYLPFKEILSLASDEEWHEAAKDLMRIRQDDSHQRLNPENVGDQMLANAFQALERIYRSADFLTDYKLCFVTDVFPDTISRDTRFTYKDLTGDSQLPRTDEESLKRIDIEKNSLYLRDGEKNWFLVRPYLHYLRCPECHQMSTFYLDKLSPADGHVMIKSFERNSSREEPYLQAFVASGLVMS